MAAMRLFSASALGLLSLVVCYAYARFMEEEEPFLLGASRRRAVVARPDDSSHLRNGVARLVSRLPLFLEREGKLGGPVFRGSFRFEEENRCLAFLCLFHDLVRRFSSV